MNDWEKFQAMWKKKTDDNQWIALEEFLKDLDSTAKWKVKETFARLATFEENTTESTDVVVEKMLP